MSPVIHFEIHASKPQALVAFYASLFGWKFQQWGEIEYWQIETGPSDQAGINGGLVPCQVKGSRWAAARTLADAVEPVLTRRHRSGLDELVVKANP